MDISLLQKARYEYRPKLPQALVGSVEEIAVETGLPGESVSDSEELKKIFRHCYGKPLITFKKGIGSIPGGKIKAGVILSGGQAPGGHNVIAGLYDGLKKGNADSELYGFLGGPSGLIENKTIKLDDKIINQYRNTGGFDMIGSGRTKIETPEQFAASLETTEKLGLNAVVIIGGDDSNTNAALLAEYFLEHNSKTQVIGCPKTIDGDLKNQYIETSFGFDTACRTYSELIGNLGRDANSAKKYWHFIKLMGRSASHITLECALQTQPNICLISEEVEAKGMSLEQIVDQICKSISVRADNNENFGIILIPEGLVEFIPEMKLLIRELNDIIANSQAEFAGIRSFSDQMQWLNTRISAESFNLLESLPRDIAMQFLMDRDPHGNVQVSRIETEKLLAGMVENKLKELKEKKLYRGKFSPLTHFFGYEGRCAFPSNFDADYCYSLGYSAFALIASGFTGYITSVRNLTAGADQWIAGGIPLTMLMNMEQRHGSKKPVIRKALVELEGRPFKFYEKFRTLWAETTGFKCPGAIQYFGPPEISDQPTFTLILEQKGEE